MCLDACFLKFIANRVLLNSVLDIVPVVRVLRPIFVVFVAFRTFMFALIDALQDAGFPG